VNWSVQLNGQFGYLHDVFFLNENKGWVCGYDGIILHTSTAGIGINKISSEIPEHFRVYNNYPNPFNPVTRIRFDVPNVELLNSNFVMKVYDILGREVFTLLDQKLNPGVYEIDFDGSNYPSGIYFCRFTAGELNHTIRMVLIK
jgi:hypothetical protein